ncbi:MAG: hypothetical protein LIO80_10785 [Lachnospiraceae bacterium]|nr:hypothetical protein [Lachnospiraceae bacterium]
MRKRIGILLAVSLSAALCLAGCGAQAVTESGTAAVSAEEENTQTSAADEADGEYTEVSDTVLEDGVYTAEFITDSSMFHVNEACDGKGTLTVEDGVMMIHVSLVSQNIVNLYYGTAEEAQEEGAVLIEPVEDEVTYSDGYTETVYGFDIPVPALDEEYSVAIIGTKGVWYDHTVSVSNPARIEGEESASEAGSGVSPESLNLADGTYTIGVTLEGGTGRANIESPAVLIVTGGAATARITWSSSNYDYMIVGEEKYLPISTEGGSLFEIPVDGFDYAMAVTADTTAMSEPHEIDYTIYFDSSTISPAE